MKRFYIAALLAGTALVPAAHAEGAQGVAQPQARSGEATASGQAMSQIQQAIEQADQALQRKDSAAARSSLDDARQLIEQSIRSASSEQKPALQELQKQVQTASDALEENDMQQARQALGTALQDRGTQTRTQASISVDVPKPDVTIQQPSPKIEVTQARPQVSVDPGQPHVTVNQPAPQVHVTTPQPTITIDMPQPQIIVEMPQPDVSVSQAQPKVSVSQEAPEVSVDQGKPQTRVGNMDAEGSPSDPATVAKGEASQVDVQKTQPQVSYNAAKPDVKVESAGDPKVEVNRTGEPDVQVRQMNAGSDQQASAQQMAKPEPATQASGSPEREGAHRAVSADASSDVSMTAGDISAYKIIGRNGNDMGSVDKVIELDSRLYAVMSSGGFFGLGAKETAIPLSSLVVSNGSLVAPNISQAKVSAFKDLDAGKHTALPNDYVITVGSW